MTKRESRDRVVRADHPVLTLHCPYCRTLVSVDLAGLEQRDLEPGDDDHHPEAWNTRCIACGVAFWQFTSVRQLANAIMLLPAPVPDLLTSARAIARAVYIQRSIEIVELGCGRPDVESLAPDPALITGSRRRRWCAFRMGVLTLGEGIASVVCEEAGLIHLAFQPELAPVTLGLGGSTLRGFRVTILAEREMTDWLKIHAGFDPREVLG